MRPLRARVLLPLLLLTACHHGAPAAARADVPAAPTAHAASPTPATSSSTASTAAAPDAAAPDDAPPSDPALLALAEQTTARVAALRGLPALRPIAKGVLDRPQILARLRARAAEEYGPGELAREGELLRRLGYLPEGMDYERTVFELLEEQVAGFYDPTARRLFLASWANDAAQQLTLSHELVHALQDQHFDLTRFTHHTRGGGDAQSAAMAVVEGDATLSMLELALAPAGRSVREMPDPDAMFRAQLMETSDQPRLAAAPAALRDTLIFPYRYGFDLCARLYTARGFGAIDALLRTPPASTEQVLHADKLARNEPPVAVPARVPEPLAGSYTLGYDDVEGELGLLLYLRNVVSAPEALDGAAGWGGDRAVLLLPAGEADAGAALARSVLAWTVVFDPGPAGRDDAEAAAFERLAARGLSVRYPHATARTVRGATRALETAPGQLAVVGRAGRTVVVLDRVPAECAPDALRAALAERGSGAVAPHAR